MSFCESEIIIYLYFLTSCSLCGGDTPFPGVKLHSESKRKAEKEGKENVTDKEKQKEKKKEKKEKKKEKKKEGNGKEKEKEGEKGEKEESGVKRFIQERDLAASAEALPAGNCDSLITDSDQSLYCMTSFDNSEVFYLGLIDFLAQYRFKKKSAHFFKVYLFFFYFFLIFFFIFSSFFFFFFFSFFNFEMFFPSIKKKK